MAERLLFLVIGLLDMVIVHTAVQASCLHLVLFLFREHLSPDLVMPVPVGIVFQHHLLM
jgi:hypothetical protein